MARFLAITSKGLLEPLAEELHDIGIKQVRKLGDSVEFIGSWADLYLVHLHSRLTTRVLLPVADFTAYNQDDLYFGIFRKHDFTQYIKPEQSLRIEAHVREHRELRDQRFVTLKAKDAIVDQFWKKFNARPDVGSEEEAALRVVVRVVGPKVSVAVDLTGESMSNRGYRKQAGEAPLREHVAAGLLRLAKYSAPTPLVDPFCGSGTILIEAALREAGKTQMQRRRPFAFTQLRNFSSETWEALKAELQSKPAPSEPFLFGYDLDSSVLEKAFMNAKIAGVEKWIRFEKCDVRELRAPVAAPGKIVTNPPYGLRLQDKPAATALMGDFASTMKKQFKGWDAYVLSGDSEVSAGLRLKAKQKFPIFNGPLECRLLHYPLT
jgi:putative N6-adenine-specific DNA methylase